MPGQGSLAWRYPPDAASRAALRAQLIEARLALPVVERAKAEDAIAARLQEVVERLVAVAARLESGQATAGCAAAPTTEQADGQAARLRACPTIAVYRPVRGEPDPAASVEAWRRRGWRLALPRVVARDVPLEFGAWPDGGALASGRFGIEQPDPFVPVRPDVIVAPCVGFDVRGWRLGYGGGFYDRTLAALGDVPAVGVAFDDARVEGFEPQPHDRRLRAVVTAWATWSAD